VDHFQMRFLSLDPLNLVEGQPSEPKVS